MAKLCLNELLRCYVKNKDQEIMKNIRKGTVVIREIITKGLLHKYYIYGGGLKGVPGIYGYSIKQKLSNEYHKGDEVKVNYIYYIRYIYFKLTLF